MTPEEIAAFVRKGQEALTALAYAARTLKEWGDAFEARGGQPAFGDDALFTVYISNDLQAFLTTERKATISRLRTDI